jgi:hypothetical protein
MGDLHQLPEQPLRGWNDYKKQILQLLRKECISNGLPVSLAEETAERIKADFLEAHSIFNKKMFTRMAEEWEKVLDEHLHEGRGEE